MTNGVEAGASHTHARSRVGVRVVGVRLCECAYVVRLVVVVR